MSTTAAAFNVRADADRAVEGLLAAGFTNDDISLLVAESAQGQHFKIAEGDKGAEGAVGGGVAGGALGAIAASLVALGIVAAPGVGLVAAGPLLAALAGAGAGAATGGLIGGLVGMGIPEHHAEVLQDQVRRGGILIAVHSKDANQAMKAQRILLESGASSLSRAAS